MNRRLRNLALSESGFLFDPSTGFTYSLNPTGAFILRQLIAGAPPEGIPARLTEEFATEADVAARDLDQFLLLLRELGLWSDADAATEGVQ